MKKASSFEELFNELNEMVINLEANPLVKRAQITIDVRMFWLCVSCAADDVASDSPDVVLNVNVKERHGSLANVVFETAADHDDYSLVFPFGGCDIGDPARLCQSYKTP